jgi:septum formation protein
VDGSSEPLRTPMFRTLQPLIMASESPRREQLLRSLGLTFEVVASGVEEEADPKKAPEILVCGHAREKAQAVSDRFSESWVLSADTVVVLREKVFGKPATAGEALVMLQQLGGRSHHVYTGLCLMHGAPAFTRTEVVRTEVHFKSLSDAEIMAYVRTGEPFDKAGAYGIQGMGAFLVESIHGSYTNVVGLPLCETLKWLLEMQIITPVLDCPPVCIHRRGAANP